MGGWLVVGVGLDGWLGGWVRGLVERVFVCGCILNMLGMMFGDWLGML